MSRKVDVGIEADREGVLEGVDVGVAAVDAVNELEACSAGDVSAAARLLIDAPERQK